MHDTAGFHLVNFSALVFTFKQPTALTLHYSTTLAFTFLFVNTDHTPQQLQQNNFQILNVIRLLFPTFEGSHGTLGKKQFPSQAQWIYSTNIPCGTSFKVTCYQANL